MKQVWINSLNAPAFLNNSRKLFFFKDPQLVTIEGVVKDADPYKIVFSQDQEMEVLIYKKGGHNLQISCLSFRIGVTNFSVLGICDSKACKEPFIVIDGATIITKQVELTGANKKVTVN